MTGVEIEARALRKSWGDTQAVDGISFTAEAGKFTVFWARPAAASPRRCA